MSSELLPIFNTLPKEDPGKLSPARPAADVRKSESAPTKGFADYLTATPKEAVAAKPKADAPTSPDKKVTSSGDKFKPTPKAKDTSPVVADTGVKTETDVKNKPTTKSNNDDEDQSTIAGAAQVTAPAAAAPAARTLATKGGSEAKVGPAELKALSAMLGRGNALMQSNPTLSLLTGQLQNLDPQTIPDLIAKNPFINSALSESDVQGLLKQDMALGDLITKLGFPPNAMKQIEAIGIDLSAKVTPAKLLSTLGIDPSSVGAELEMLKANLMLEGAAPYMERAQKLSKFSPMEPALTPDVPQGPVATPFAKTTGHDSLAFADTFKPKQTTNFEAPVAQSAPQANAQPASAMSISDLIKANLQAPSAKAKPVDLQKMTSEVSLADVIPMEKMADPSALSGFDQRMATAATERIVFPEQANAMNAKVAGPIAMASATMIADSAKEIRPDNTKIEKVVSDDMSLNFGKDAIQNIGDKSQKGAMVNTIERLMSNQLVAPTLQGEGSSSDSKDQSQKFDDSAKDLSLPQIGGDLKGAHTAKASFADHVTAGKSLELASNIEKALKDVKNAVAEKANLMVREGGGSVIMDLGTKETGKLEIALDVSQHNVGIKIITASEHVKDMLVNDIQKLKEALSSQNLDLKQVDVGFRRDFQQPQQHQQQNLHQQFADHQKQQAWVRDNVSQKLGQLKSSYQATPIRSVPVRSHAGNIQVLA